MTCVWDALRSKLRPDDLKSILGMQTSTPQNMVMCLKSKNKATVGVKWQGVPLTQKEMLENIEWIKNHDASTINRGYDCSSCDPYLLLVCYLFNVRIAHQYLNNQIIYDPPGTARYQLNFVNNRGHFW